MHVVNMACQNNAQGVALAGKTRFDQRVRGLYRELEQNSR